MFKKKGIYSIWNKENSKIYIGSAVDINGRIKQHKKELKEKKHHSISLQKDWDIYGGESFSFDILEEVYDPENKQLAAREQFWIDEFDSYESGYNENPIASRPHTYTDHERALLNEERVIERLTGSYEQNYVHRIREQHYNLDEEEQIAWEKEFKLVAERYKKNKRAATLTVGIIVVVLLRINLVFLLFAALPLFILWGAIGFKNEEEYSKLKGKEPRLLAEKEGQEKIDEERQKRRRPWRPLGF